MHNHLQRISEPEINVAKLMKAKLMEISSASSSGNKNQENQDEDLHIFSQAIDDYVAQPLNGEIAEKDQRQKNLGTILIVDDTPDNLLVLFSYLEDQGFKVLLAEDGKTGLKIAQAKVPDLILLDVLMPEMDGFETCRQLKEKVDTKEIPVIFLTALSETVNKVKGFKLGGVDYITKPSEQEEVLVRIQTHLNLCQMRQTLAQQSQTLTKQNQKLQQAWDFETVVRHATEKIRDSLDESQILVTATQELAEVLELSSCQIELYNSKQTTATVAYEHTLTLPQSQGISRNITDFPELYEQLLQKSSLQFVEPIPQFNPQAIQVSRLACPIFDDRGIIGNLWGLRPPDQVFSTLEIQLMQQMAAQCAIAIRQARLYEASNQQIIELAKLNQLKDDFLKTISHELKAPVSSIQLAAETMEILINNKQSLNKSATFKRVINIFRNSCTRQKQLVDDLLTLCYVDAKAETVKLELVDLHQWLPDLTQLYLQRAESQKQQIILDLAVTELEVSVDPMILERIVREFLHNACKYTPAEQSITIHTEARESDISLCVINTGVEIPIAEQELIFDQFYRIPKNDPWKHGGTGLGLTLVRKLATMLEATVDVSSANGQTVFCIRFSN